MQAKLCSLNVNNINAHKKLKDNFLLRYLMFLKRRSSLNDPPEENIQRRSQEEAEGVIIYELLFQPVWILSEILV